MTTQHSVMHFTPALQMTHLVLSAVESFLTPLPQPPSSFSVHNPPFDATALRRGQGRAVDIALVFHRAPCLLGRRLVLVNSLLVLFKRLPQRAKRSAALSKGASTCDDTVLQLQQWRSQQGAWMVYLNKGDEIVFNNTFLRVKAACSFCSWCWLTLGGETRRRLLQQHLHACCHRHCQQYPMCRPRHTKKYKCGARGIRAEGFDRRALVVLLCST